MENLQYTTNENSIKNGEIGAQTLHQQVRHTSTKALSIAIVSPYPPSKGTLNEYAFHLVEQFKKKSEIREIHLITDILPNGESYSAGDRPYNVHLHPVWSFNDKNTLLKIRKSLKTINPDVVLYNLQFLSFGDNKVAATLGLLSPLISKLEGIPSIVLLHNIIETVDYDSAGITSSKFMTSLYNFIGKQITRIILSANMVGVTIPKYVNILEKKYGCKNVALLPHGSFEMSERPNLEYNPEKRSILTFGKFGTYKKVENLIEAMILVREETSLDIELTIAGTDNPNVKGYLKSVEEKYSHIEGIHFTGYVEEEDVPVHFSNSTIVAFDYTSTTGSSGVLHQAGSYGKAVMLPNIGDLKELITEEGFAGTYFNPNDIQGMAIAMKKLLCDDQTRIEIAKQNYAAASGLRIGDIADWYVMHFNELVKK